MSMRPTLLGIVLLGAFASSAHADTLYKCVDATGLPSIQHDPCPKGQTQAWARETKPEPPPTPEKLAEQQARRDREERERIERTTAEAIAYSDSLEAERLRKEEADRVQANKAARSAGVEADDARTPPPADGEVTTRQRCDEAKAFAQGLRGKPWLDLDRAQWGRVYGWVFQQCR